ncbi:3-keto-5-aminohexanoate cleavage protein [Leucobacter allii]|uniref:3-keto-5-aminohexanoate cleavage protein n=1 Tax=Leucobacter allii TaxID=2932247 RepID=A0ABY4FJW5_9MICO|nr:3-keto-5-aminohexanoate cleavage protein [Leucobacter allii]UOQ56448.1 3-keto-5-aminohexanoate cleavage protein [Leucobacter allii]
MTRGKYDPVAITAAVTGGDVLPSQSSAIPCRVEDVVTQSVAAVEAGASVIHLHARDDDGRPSADQRRFIEIVEGIRERVDAVISISTGGSPHMTAEERLAGALVTRPELATFNLGTMNYEGYPDPARWPSVQHAWEREVLERSGTVVFTNTLAMLRDFAARFKEQRITPELEIYDLSHIGMARYLIDAGVLEAPVRVQFVLGVLGGAGNDLEDLFHLHATARRVLGDDLGVVGVAATGYPMQFRHASLAAGMGLDVRVGLEDSLRMTRAEQAGQNADLVEVAARLVTLQGRALQTPDEVRAGLGPWWSAS